MTQLSLTFLKDTDDTGQLYAQGGLLIASIIQSSKRRSRFNMNIYFHLMAPQIDV